ncbi:LysR family transcriptional regulator [Paenirhodobacter sp.]|uniref:LysR family transcriptional regulator n=1 Tax=Paenirhodobacter sp. TaxID=1965326 RepID=UPI003B3E34BF
MLIRHLEFFVTLAEEGHFGRAADLCGVSQPALSLAIRKLEEDLGTPLILRGQRFQGLTAEGEKALVWGRQILSDYRNLKSDLNGRRVGGLTGVLRLGVSAAAMPLMPEFCAGFERRNPLTRTQITLLTAAEIQAGLQDFSLDGGIGWLPGQGKGMTPLWRTHLRFACRADHPFAEGGPLTMADAMTQPLCQIADMPVKVQAAILCSGLDAVLAHLRSGAWCSLVPDSFAALLSDTDDIRLIPLADGGAPHTLGGMVIPRSPQTPMVRGFEDALAALSPAQGNARQAQEDPT